MDLVSVLKSFGRRDWQQVDGGTIRVALIGLGWWIRDRAIPAIDAADRCEATVFVSSYREKARAIADATPTAGRGLTYDEFHDGEATEEYDAVYVSTPNALHLPYVESAAELGTPPLRETDGGFGRARRVDGGGLRAGGRPP